MVPINNKSKPKLSTAIKIIKMPRNYKNNKHTANDEEDVYDEDSFIDNSSETNTKRSNAPKSSALSRRRQVHLVCEHRRRKEIQDALDALNAELPNVPKARSKIAIIADTAEHIQELTFALDRLLNENQILTNQVNASGYAK